MAQVHSTLTDEDVIKFKQSVERNIEALKNMTPEQVRAKLRAEKAPGFEDKED